MRVNLCRLHVAGTEVWGVWRGGGNKVFWGGGGWQVDRTVGGQARSERQG